MLRKTKKLTLAKDQLRLLVDTSLERVRGGYLNTSGSQWCSTSNERKCTYGCPGDVSMWCVNG
jgi:hypothetical protein